jgi:hypothetical protein
VLPAAERRTAVAETVQLLAELASQNDWRVVPDVLNILAWGEPEVVAAAERALASLERCVPIAGLPRLETTVRDATCGSWAWHNLSETAMRSHHWQPASLALFTMHPSGYIRQPGLEWLDASGSDRALPYLLLRLNDWVEPVRRSAEAAVRRRLVPDRLAEWTACLVLIGALERRGRTDHSWLVAEVGSLLRQPAARATLKAQAQSSDRLVARAAFGIALGLAPGEAAPFLDEALSHSDPAIRVYAARQIRALRGLPDRDRMIQRMSQDRFMPVRREALYEIAAGIATHARAWLTDALLDSHPSMRHAARAYLRLVEGEADFDARGFYLEQLKQKGPDAPATLIAALGETGRPEDADLLLPYFSHQKDRVAAAAVRAIWALDGEHRIRLLEEWLGDPRPAVGAMVARVLAGVAGSIDPQRLRSLLQPNRPAHTRQGAVRLLLRQHPHEAMPDIIAAACSDEPTVTAKAREYLTRLRPDAVAFGAAPHQAAATAAALEQARGGLPADLEKSVRRFML